MYENRVLVIKTGSTVCFVISGCPDLSCPLIAVMVGGFPPDGIYERTLKSHYVQTTPDPREFLETRVAVGTSLVQRTIFQLPNGFELCSLCSRRSYEAQER